MTVANKPVKTGTRFHSTKLESERGHWLAITILAAIATAVFGPILVHPHWGFFSDAGQILENCRMFFGMNNMQWPLFIAQYRPGFNILDKIVWLFSPEQPFGFYLFRWMVFAATVTLTYLNCYELSRSKLFSFLFPLFFFVASPTYEVIYTLDKGEGYIGLLFSTFMAIFLRTQSVLAVQDVSFKPLIQRKIALAGTVAYAIFTKQTGQLFLLISGVFAAATVIARWKPGFLPMVAGVDERARTRQMKWGLSALVISVCCYLAFLLFLALTEGFSYKYGATKFGTKYLWSQLQQYSYVVPDLLGLLAASIVGAVALPVVRKDVVARSPYSYIYAVGLTLCALAGTTALLSWVGNLSYIWFPIYALTLPLSCYFVSSMFNRSLKFKVPVVVSLVMLLALMIPGRSIEAQFQFKQDRLASSLTLALSKLAQQSHKQVRLIMPFTNPACTESGERIESLTMNNLVHNYMEAKPDSTTPVRMYNFVEYCVPPGLQNSPPLEHYSSKIDAVPVAGYKPTPGMDIYSYWSEHGHVHAFHWDKDKLHTGDVLLIPHGDIPRNASVYRGASLFFETDKTQTLFIPQVHLKPVVSVGTGIRALDSSVPFARFGWTAFKITKIDPISWPISHDGWLMHNAFILYDASIAGKTMTIDSIMSFPKSINVTCGTQTQKVNAEIVGDGVRQFRIPIPSSGPPKLVVSSDDPTHGLGDPRPLMLHVDKVSVQ